MAEPQIDVMSEGGSQSLSAKYAVNPQTGQVMRNDGSGWSKVKSAKNAQGEILINEGGTWMPVPKGDQARQPMTRKDVVPLMAREGLEWGTSDESAGVRRAAGLPEWVDKAINATPLAPFINMGTGLGAIGAEAAGANMPDAYTEARDEVRGDINQAREEYPVTSFASEIAGGIAYPGGAMKPGAPMVKQVPRMAGIGATQGGSYAFNAAEGDVGDRLEAGKTGAAFGAALGGALPPAVAAGRVPARSAKNAVAGLYDGLLGLFGKQGGARMSAAEQTAVAAVRRSMERSQLNPQQILDAVREFEGKPAVLAEVIGQDAVNALTSLTRRPGSTPQKAQAIIEDRYGGFVDRAQDDLRKATGLTDDQIAGKFDSDLAARRKKAAPLYKGVFDTFGTISSPRLRGLGETSDTLRKAMGRAKKALSDEAAITGKAPTEMSQLQYWDLVKRQLDDAYDAAAAKPGNNDEMRRIEMIRKEVVGQLDAYTGGKGGPYAAAREAGGEAPRMIEARAQGEKAMRPSTSRQTVQDQVSALNPQDQMPYASGVAGKIDEDLAGGRMTPQRIARVPANREKITTALGEDAGGQFVGKMEAEAKLRDTGSRWAPRMNSVTGTVLEGGPSQAVDDAIMMGAAAARGDKVSLITNAVRFMRRRGYNQREIDAMGDLLLSNPMEGLRRLGVRLPSGGNGGAPANVFANGGQSVQQSTSQPVNSFAPQQSPVRGAGFSGFGGGQRSQNVFSPETTPRSSDLANRGNARAYEDAVAQVESARNNLWTYAKQRYGVAVDEGGNDAVINRLASEANDPELTRRLQAYQGAIDNQLSLDRAGNVAGQRTTQLSRQAQEAQERLYAYAKAKGVQVDEGGNDGFLNDVVRRSGDPEFQRLLDDYQSAIQGQGRARGFTTSGISSVGGADVGNAAVGGAVGGFAPAENTEDRVRNVFAGAAIGATGGRLDRMLPGRTANSAGAPRIRKDIPKGTPKQSGPSRMSGSIQRGLEESSSMGAAKATGDKAVRQKTAMSEASRMADAGRNYVDVFEKTGVVLIPYKGGTIKYYAPGADHPDTVIRTFIADLNKPLEKRQPMTNTILTAIGEQEQPLMLGRQNTPMIEGTGNAPQNVFAR